MGYDKVQSVLRDDNGDYREVLLDLTADPVTGKMVAIGTDRNPVLQEAPILFTMVPDPSLPGRHEFLMRETDRLVVPVGYTYQFEFSVLLLHADFSVLEFRGFATVQNTGGVVAGVGHWYTQALQMGPPGTGEFVWFTDGLGAGTRATYLGGGPGAEDFFAQFFLDTLSDDNAVRFLVGPFMDGGVVGQLQVRILNKLGMPMPGGSSGSSPSYSDQYLISGAEFPWTYANGTYFSDGDYNGFPSWASPNLVYLWNNGMNWIISSGKGGYYADWWMGPTTDQDPDSSVYWPQNDAVGIITVVPA